MKYNYNKVQIYNLKQVSLIQKLKHQINLFKMMKVKFKLEKMIELQIILKF